MTQPRVAFRLWRDHTEPLLHWRGTCQYCGAPLYVEVCLRHPLYTSTWTVHHDEIPLLCGFARTCAEHATRSNVTMLWVGEALGSLHYEGIMDDARTRGQYVGVR